MSDELDPELSRLFAAANQDLPGTDFQQRLAARLNRRRSWLGMAGGLASTTQAVLSGIALGLAAPFGTRVRHVGLMAASGAAVMVWLTLQLT